MIGPVTYRDDFTPRRQVFFGAQTQSVGFFERIGAVPGPAGFILRA